MDFPYWSRFRMRVIGRCAKLPAQIGIPIKIVDKTLTPKKKVKFKILNPQKIVWAPVVGKSQSTPPGGAIWPGSTLFAILAVSLDA